MFHLNLEYKRQSGRTSRLLVEAKEAFDEGDNVVIIVRDCDFEVNRTYYLLQLPVPAKWVAGPTFHVLRHDQLKHFDWDTLQFKEGPHVKAKLFIDHDVFERKYRHILNAWTKYDAPPETIPGIANRPEEMIALLEASRLPKPQAVIIVKDAVKELNIAHPSQGEIRRHMPVIPTGEFNSHIGRGLTTPEFYGEREEKKDAGQ